MKYFFVLIFLLASCGAFTQPATDSLKRPDSLLSVDSVRKDSMAVATLPVIKQDTIHPVLQYAFDSDSFLYRKRLFFSFTNPVLYTVSEKTWQSKEAIFYSVIALFLFFAIIKNAFYRYLTDLFSSYFRTTMRQRQIKEQLLQSPLPSLLFNGLFIVSGAIFLCLVFQFFGIAAPYPFWLMVGYSALGLLVIYTGKFLVLKFFGWVFQLSDATDTYVFIVFSTNKIIGVLLLPFIALLAFTYGNINTVAVTLSLMVVGFLFAYRYFLAFISINPLVKISFLHFLIYLAAFEILPLLLINKLLFTIVGDLS